MFCFLSLSTQYLPCPKTPLTTALPGPLSSPLPVLALLASPWDVRPRGRPHVLRPRGSVVADPAPVLADAPEALLRQWRRRSKHPREHATAPPARRSRSASLAEHAKDQQFDPRRPNVAAVATGDPNRDEQFQTPSALARDVRILWSFGPPRDPLPVTRGIVPLRVPTLGVRPRSIGGDLRDERKVLRARESGREVIFGT